MSIHTLCLDCVILAAAVHPSGFSYSLYSAVWGRPRQVSARLLAMLLLPFLAVVPTVGALRPSLLALNGAAWPMFAAAVLLVPVAIAMEYVIHAIPLVRATGRWPTRIGLSGPWGGRRTALDHLLLAGVAVGEEIFFRAIWLGTLVALGVAAPLALVLSSLAYGLNHLFAGTTSVVSKSATGLLYGLLYLAGGQSVVLPVIAHVLQNATLFAVAGERDA